MRLPPTLPWPRLEHSYSESAGRGSPGGHGRTKELGARGIRPLAPDSKNPEAKEAQAVHDVASRICNFSISLLGVLPVACCRGLNLNYHNRGIFIY